MAVSYSACTQQIDNDKVTKPILNLGGDYSNNLPVICDKNFFKGYHQFRGPNLYGKSNVLKSDKFTNPKACIPVSTTKRHARKISYEYRPKL